MLLALLRGASASFPDFTGYVVDRAGILDASAKEHVTAVASRLDHAGIAQLAVATVTPADLGDRAVQEYSVALFEKWGIGHGTKRDDGVLVLFVPGPPGKRWIWISVGYGLEGILPDGKVGQIRTEQAFPYMKNDDYSRAAIHVADAIAAVVEKDAAAGGDAAASREAPRRGVGIGMPGFRAPIGLAGLGVTIVCMVALAILLSTSAARRRRSLRVPRVAAARLRAQHERALRIAKCELGWLALVAGLILNAVLWASIRSHKCPRDGSWMLIEEELISRPTYFSQGRARVRQICTNPRCGYRREYDKVLPRKQMVVMTGGRWGGGGGGGWGGGGGGFSGGGGGRTGGGGAGGAV